MTLRALFKSAANCLWEQMIEIIQLFKYYGTENKEICLVFNIIQNYLIKICSREILYLFRTSYLQTFFFFCRIYCISLLFTYFDGHWVSRYRVGAPSLYILSQKGHVQLWSCFFCPDLRAVLLHWEFKAVSKNNHCESSGDTAGWFPISWCLTALQKPSRFPSFLTISQHACNST